MPDYIPSEPICIIFPSNRSTILKDISCDIPATRGLDLGSVSFHGELDQDGTPLTCPPAELAIAGLPVYSSANVSGLGFISEERRTPRVIVFLYCALIVGAPLGLLPFERGSGAQICLYITYIVFCWMLWMGFLDEETVVRRKRSVDETVSSTSEYCHCSIC